MANDLNQCNFIGRLGADPEIRYRPEGGAVGNFSIACNWKSKDKEGSEWVRIVVYDRLAEICGEYLRKGSKVFVSGRLRTRKWQDQQGVERYTTEIIASELQMLDGAPDNSGQSSAPRRQSSAGQANTAQTGYGKQQAAPAQGQMPMQGGYHNNTQGQRAPVPGAMPPPVPPIDFEDDIPFAPLGLQCKRILHCI